VALGAACALGLLGAGSGQAATAGPTSVRGPGSPVEGMYLSSVGCADPQAATTQPATRLNLGPGTAPLGTRSFGLVPSAAGTASGPVLGFESLADLGAAFSARAQHGTTGVGYVWVTTPDAGAGHAWRGRAEVTVPAGDWVEVDTSTLSYRWELVDLAAGTATGGDSATIDAFVASHGTGPGFSVTGLGCDAQPFHLDAVRGNGRVWDFEGLVLSTDIQVSSTQPRAGEAVVVTGVVRDQAGRATGDPLVLQSRAVGEAQWHDAETPALAQSGPAATVRVRPTGPTEYRWYRPASEYADAGWSESVVVQALAPEPEETPETPETPTPSVPAPSPGSGTQDTPTEGTAAP